MAALRRAQERAANANERERALIEALARRYADPPPADRAALDSAYADAMRALADRYPEDVDIQTLYAEAIMLLSPWRYWYGTQPRPGTAELPALALPGQA
jgi:hypothetical protein